MEASIIITGMLVFIARVVDVSLGTVRTIVTVQGRMTIAFVLGLFEISIWITVVSTVISQINQSPILVGFYALGYATGNVVGIIVERRLAFGAIILRIITEESKAEIIAAMKKLFLNVTSFSGMGSMGPVTEMYVVCRRRDLKIILPKIREIDPNAFYVTEQANDVSKVLRPFNTPVTGWRSVFKKK